MKTVQAVGPRAGEGCVMGRGGDVCFCYIPGYTHPCFPLAPAGEDQLIASSPCYVTHRPVPVSVLFSLGLLGVGVGECLANLA